MYACINIWVTLPFWNYACCMASHQHNAAVKRHCHRFTSHNMRARNKRFVPCHHFQSLLLCVALHLNCAICRLAIAPSSALCLAPISMEFASFLSLVFTLWNWTCSLCWQVCWTICILRGLFLIFVPITKGCIFLPSHHLLSLSWLPYNFVVPRELSTFDVLIMCTRRRIQQSNLASLYFCSNLFDGSLNANSAQPMFDQTYGVGSCDLFFLYWWFSIFLQCLMFIANSLYFSYIHHSIIFKFALSMWNWWFYGYCVLGKRKSQNRSICIQLMRWVAVSSSCERWYCCSRYKSNPE